MDKTEAYLRYKKKGELLDILKTTDKKADTTVKEYDDLRMLLDSMDHDALVRLLLNRVEIDNDLKATIERELLSRSEDIPNFKIILAQLRDWSELLPKDLEVKRKIKKLNRFLNYNPEIKFQFQKLFTDASKGIMDEEELEAFSSKFSELAPVIWKNNNLKFFVIFPIVLFMTLLAATSLTNTPKALAISSVITVLGFFYAVIARYFFLHDIFMVSTARKDINVIGNILKTQNEFVRLKNETDDNLLPEETNPVSLDAVLNRLADTHNSEPNLLETLGQTSEEIQNNIQAMLDL